MALLTKNQERILNRLKQVSEILRNTLNDLKIENISGQFDMINCSDLGTTVDTIQTLASKINDIVEQRVKRG